VGYPDWLLTLVTTLEDPAEIATIYPKFKTSEQETVVAVAAEAEPHADILE
jgi:hypothetical protein